jgi:hypothetical protein
VISRDSMRILTLLLAWTFMFNAVALPLNTEEKKKMCQQLLLDEFKKLMSGEAVGMNPGEGADEFLNLQMMITAMKLADKVLKRKGLSSQTTNAYLQSILGNKTREKLNGSTAIQQNIQDLYDRYGDKEALPDVSVDQLLDEQSPLNDQQLSKFMITMEETWKDKTSFGFDKNDYAIAWLSNQMTQAGYGQNSYLISKTVQQLLSQVDLSNPKGLELMEKTIAHNLKVAQDKIKGKLQKVKFAVFNRHKDICLNKYSGVNITSQNESVYAMCRGLEQQILDETFTMALEDILKSGLGNAPIRLALTTPNGPITDDEARLWQDKINDAELSDRERILMYYKSPLPTNREQCPYFTMFDKKKQMMSVYHNSGDLIMESKMILGQGVRFDNKRFHPDSALRKFPKLNPDGTPKMNPKTGRPDYHYTRTTGAGVFYSKALSSQERKARKYDDEFNDRVIVMTSQSVSGDSYTYPETIQAVHGVPNAGWVRNRHTRMSSFDNPHANMKLSTGCVNLEGYTYDILSEFNKDECPMYILPEDPKNYFVVKNRKLNFSSSVAERKKGKEKSKKKVGGQFVDDPQNTNQYYFTPRNLEFHISGYQVPSGKSDVVDAVFDAKEELFSRAKVMENDTFEDFTKLTYGITTNPQEAKDVFINLYSAYYRSVHQDGSHIDFMPTDEKRKLILERYKKDFAPTVDVDTVLAKSREVTFKHK